MLFLGISLLYLVSPAIFIFVWDTIYLFMNILNGLRLKDLKDFKRLKRLLSGGQKVTAEPQY